MMIRSLLVPLFLAGAFSGAEIAGSGSQRVSFCRALEEIKPGETIPVVVSGVYEVSYEFAVFFDPAQPVCKTDVQPATWVDFAQGFKQDKTLSAIVRRDRRALVTFQGRLVGPGVVGPDDPSLPFAAAFSNRIARRRYGHLNSFRTRFEVDAVSDVSAVPESVPWEWGGEPSPAGGPPVPLRIAIPQYPEPARKLGIEGSVTLEVSVREGQVQTARVTSGDRVLAGAAEANVRTWVFDPGTSTAITPTFVYRLEDRQGGDQAVRLELKLPERLVITAASFRW